MPHIGDLKEVKLLQDKAWKTSVEEKANLPVEREMKAFVSSDRAAREKNGHIVTISKLK